MAVTAKMVKNFSSRILTFVLGSWALSKRLYNLAN